MYPICAFYQSWVKYHCLMIVHVLMCSALYLRLKEFWFTSNATINKQFEEQQNPGRSIWQCYAPSCSLPSLIPLTITLFSTIQLQESLLCPNMPHYNPSKCHSRFKIKFMYTVVLYTIRLPSVHATGCAVVGVIRKWILGINLPLSNILVVDKDV